jgi:hypothetical protein
MLLLSESESELLYDWRFTENQFILATSPFRPTTRIFIFQLNTCGYSSYVTSSPTRGRVCRLQLLLVLASAVILWSESRGTRDHILLSQIRDFLFRCWQWTFASTLVFRLLDCMSHYYEYMLNFLSTCIRYSNCSERKVGD